MVFGAKLIAHCLAVALNVYAAVALDHAEHRAIGLAVRLARKASRWQAMLLLIQLLSAR